MQLYTSYDDAFQAALATQRFAFAHLQDIKLPMNIDTSGCYKLFYFISGAKKFHIGHMVYDIQPGDLFFVNQREWHYFSHISPKDNHERIVLFIYPDFLKQLCTDQTDLCACFQHYPDTAAHKLRLQPKESNRFLHAVYKLESDNGFGEDLITMSVFLELMVFVNRIRRMQESPVVMRNEEYGMNLNHSDRLGPVFTYIDNHITEDLSLEHLSGQFFLTPSYLCRIFKKDTGTTIHKYITARRITLAKDLLTQGYSVTEACTQSGFKDYNGFLKSFVNSVGISPKKYAQFSD